MQCDISVKDSLYKVNIPFTFRKNGAPNNLFCITVPAIDLASLGDRSFCDDLGLQFPCVAGAMANGICSSRMVESMGKAGMLAFFGSAGLSPQCVAQAINQLQSKNQDFPYGFNLIHSPHDPLLEEAIVDLYLKNNIRLVEASAYLKLTLPLVRYRLAGIYHDENGNIITPNHVIAKVSRIEVATRFFSPAPDSMINSLVEQGDLTSEQAELARKVPIAQDITAEADSGGHTDNSNAVSLLPTLVALKNQIQNKAMYNKPLRIGIGGGIATPMSAAAGFAMGAAYVVTGSINQACLESGTNNTVRKMLSAAQQADVTMAPAADMFEMGVKVQVLKRGTMFAMRAGKLFQLYQTYESLEQIPPHEKLTLEKNIFQAPIEQIWSKTTEYFRLNDPRQIERALKDPKHRMALIFRWYLGKSSNWANTDVSERAMDYQIWCGPAMGAFNEWAKGTFLEAIDNRDVATVNLNIVFGAAVLFRLNMLRIQGIRIPADWMNLRPLELKKIREYLK